MKLRAKFNFLLRTQSLIFIDMDAVFSAVNSGATNIEEKKIPFKWSSDIVVSLDAPRNCPVRISYGLFFTTYEKQEMHTYNFSFSFPENYSFH